MSAFTPPILVDEHGTAQVLERLPLSAGAVGLFSERWLQRALFASPAALPVREIDPHIGDLIPICMELETGAGCADLLYVTSTGQIVLAETKLWRNPEARREVVAQILDYAKQLTGWTYDDLAREASKASGEGPGYVLACARRAHPRLEDAAFVDGVNRCLAAGDFLLLIVGDGIRTGAQSLVGFIEQYGNLRFDLGLIEVAAYRVPDGRILLQPRILARTELLRRTVLVGTNNEVVRENDAADQPAPTGSQAELEERARWFQAFWGDFQATLRLDDATQPLPSTVPKATTPYLAQPPSGSDAWIATNVSRSTGRASVHLTFSRRFVRAASYYQALVDDRENIDRESGVPLEWSADEATSKFVISTDETSFKSLDSPVERARVIEFLADRTNRLVNAFRHRLNALAVSGL